MKPEDVRGLQCQISDVLRDYASRIRNNGRDLATVRKVLGEVRESAAEWLRQTGGPQETVHLDAPGGAACADPSDEVTVSASLDAVTCAACRAARVAEDAPGVHPLAQWLARNVVLQDGTFLALRARAAEPRRPYPGESRLAYWTALLEQAKPAAELVLALVAQHSERAAEILEASRG